MVLRWFFSGIWLIYLIGPVADLFEVKYHHSPLYQACGRAGRGVLRALRLPRSGPGGRTGPVAGSGSVVLAGLATAISLTYGAEWTSIFIYVSAAAGFIIWDRRRAMLAVGACTVAYVVAVGDRAHHVRLTCGPSCCRWR